MSVATIETILGYELDPVVHLFPEADDDEIQALSEDILANGQLEPCLLWRGKIIDGRNRLLACERAGIPCIVRDWVPGPNPDPLALAVSRNLHRRHLTPGQKAEIAAEVSRLYKAAAAERKASTQAQPGVGKVGRKTSPVAAHVQPPEEVVDSKGRAVEKAAKLVGVSPRAVYQAETVRQKAPDVAAKLKRGEVSLRQAVAETKARTQPEPDPDDERRERWRNVCTAVERLYETLAAAELTRDGSDPAALVADLWPATPHRATFGPVVRRVSSIVAAIAEAVGDRT